MNAEAARIVERLGLEPLPQEGGFFRRIWTSAAMLENGRAAGSAIAFLLTETDFSALHRFRSEEVWFFHDGDAIEHVQLVPGRAAPVVTTLGSPRQAETTAHVCVPGGVWQGARLKAPRTRGWALVSCVVAPAWDEREFVLGERAALAREFPAAAEWIRGLTR